MPDLSRLAQFRYLPRSRVLLCTTCSYCVLRPAIEGHLKCIHRLSRSEREPYITATDMLDLATWNDVAYPEPKEAPIPGLPVHRGFACRAPGCDHFCATRKRMQAHWRSEHTPHGETVRLGDGCCRPVELQTFFRGRHLRYFQVTSSACASAPSKTAAQEFIGPLHPSLASLKKSGRFSTTALEVTKPWFEADRPWYNGGCAERQISTMCAQRPRAHPIINIPNRLCCSLLPSIEDQASTAFLINLVAELHGQEISLGMMDMLVPLYQASRPGSALHLATSALAMRTMSHGPLRPRLVERSVSLYGRAMVAVQRAMQDACLATSDEILLSVLIFALYELSTPSEQSIEAWGRHVDGSVSIVKARGTRQLQDPRSRTLVHATRMQMLNKALWKGEAVVDLPEPKAKLDEDGSWKARNTAAEHAIRWRTLFAEARSLLGSDGERDVECGAKVTALLRRAYSLQQELMIWEANLPAHYGCRSIAHLDLLPDDVENAQFWPGTMHIFQNLLVASIRLTSRMSQVFCWVIIADALQWLFPESYPDDDRWSVAQCRIRSLVNDIAASVPYHLGYASEHFAIAPQDTSGTVAGAYLLLGPLHVTSQLECVPVLQRAWLRGRLTRTVTKFGLEQASSPRADDLKTHGRRNEAAVHYIDFGPWGGGQL